MAVYHLTTKPISRAMGRSGPASSAYRSAEIVHDHSTGETWDYTRKQGVEHSEILLPTAAAERDINWARDREQLWNAAELAEKRIDARVAREWEVALAHELSKVQRIDLAREFAGEIANRYGCAVDVAVHAPHRSGDTRNHHAHLLATTRTIEADGFGRKTDIELGDRDRGKKGLGRGADEISHMRERWAVLTNERLQELGLSIRVDHRSLKEQGIEREPTVHLGPAVTGMERRGIETEVGNRVREERALELERAQARTAELQQLARESREVEHSIFDLSGNLKAALKERELALGHGLEQAPGQTREVPSSARREGLSLAERFEQQARAAEQGAAQAFAAGWEKLGKERTLIETELQSVEEARERRAQELEAERAQEKTLGKTLGKAHAKEHDQSREMDGPRGHSIPLPSHERTLTIEERDRERDREIERDRGLDLGLGR